MPRGDQLSIWLIHALHKAGFRLYTLRAADGNRGVWRVAEAFKRAIAAGADAGRAGRVPMSRALLSPPGAGVLPPEVASAFDKIHAVLVRAKPVRGLLPSTDYSWYRFLLTQTDLDEATFRQPGGGRRFGSHLRNWRATTSTKVPYDY